ncbi:SDR family NAD(P)-dependent oxidoreductase [Kitasatospora cheerisanensis]|uniref:Oxidoreductase, short chain dehydrogenase/reductase family protein n=1 Tax=Kitasatospora cheerisanensis KCTC 2395 TaxID=1348663 RepID=A0A066Z110_9ACTN|nr:SDR family oxidoreductase [Kitasatospora cheerisanensis]KDN83850.1 oxidoreductase, short chain dehydrogenase/reductase family protein [Kitasatospora cheerisanensis KCTC 2395]
MTGLPFGRARRRDGWAVVTGASSGIGEALAHQLAGRGHRLQLVARRKDRLERLAQELRQRHRVAVEVRECDLADRAERAALCEHLAGLEIAILANNAGFTTCGPLAGGDARREAQEVEVNAVAVHELTLAVLPGMLARRSGRILFTGSTAGMQPVPTAATYAATKAFVNTFAESLHGELRGTGVSCTLLAPGPVRSEFMAVGGAQELEERRWFAWQTPETVAKAGLRAARWGRRVSVPGPMAKLQGLAGRHVPHGLTFLLLRTVVLPRMRSPKSHGGAP